MKIEILGSGCANCRKLEANARSAARKAGIDAVIEKVSDAEKIMNYHVLMTPALIVDGQVKSSGKVLSEKEISALLQSE